MPLLPLLLIALQAAPTIHEDLEALEGRIIATTGAAIGAPGGPAHGLDRRLRLHRCPVAAAIANVRGGLTVACPARGWRLHVALMNGGPNGEQNGGQAGGAVVRRGDVVLVRIRGRGFAAGLRATALEDGAVGARIRLRPSASPSSSIMAIITGPGEATPAT